LLSFSKDGPKVASVLLPLADGNNARSLVLVQREVKKSSAPRRVKMKAAIFLCNRPRSGAFRSRREVP
jgi:hypothetical protein